MTMRMPFDSAQGPVAEPVEAQGPIVRNPMNIATKLLVGFITVFCLQARAQNNAPPARSSVGSRCFLGLGPAVHFGSLFSAASLRVEPRFNLINRYSDLSFGITAPLAVGYSPDSAGVFADVPILAEFNIGNSAHKNFYNSTGIAIGLGYGTHFISRKSFSGITGSLAFRCWMFKHPFTLRYMSTLSNDRGASPLNSLAMTFYLGKWVKTNRDYNKISNFIDPYKK